MYLTFYKGINNYFHMHLFQSEGQEVVDLLQYLCSNDVDVPIGSIIHTGMQNIKGGYENDCSLARISKNQSVFIYSLFARFSFVR